MSMKEFDDKAKQIGSRLVICGYNGCSFAWKTLFGWCVIKMHDRKGNVIAGYIIKMASEADERKLDDFVASFCH